MSRKFSPRGFTLIEILVVIAIIILLSGIIFSNYRSGESQFALLRSAHKLTQDIRRAQEMAMSMREYPGPIPKGYGVYFNFATATQYLIYRDISEPTNKRYDRNEEIETLFVEKGVKISKISLSTTTPITMREAPTKAGGLFTFLAQTIKTIISDIFFSQINGVVRAAIVPKIIPPPDGGEMIIPLPDGGEMIIPPPPPDGEEIIIPPPDGGEISIPQPGGGGISINFSPPDPTTTIKADNNYTYSQVEITLELIADPSKRKKITVNRVGLIDLD